MKTTNQIEEALISKAKEEIGALVDEFESKLEQLNSKYKMNPFYEINRGGKSVASCLRLSEFRNILRNSLVESLTEGILRYKAKELINKLDLV